MERLVAQRLRRGELSRVDVPGCKLDACWHVTLLQRQHQSVAASSFRRYLGTPEAMHLMRAPGGGVPPSRFRPPVYVTIWSSSRPRVRQTPVPDGWCRSRVLRVGARPQATGLAAAEATG